MQVYSKRVRDRLWAVGAVVSSVRAVSVSSVCRPGLFVRRLGGYNMYVCMHGCTSSGRDLQTGWASATLHFSLRCAVTCRCPAVPLPGECWVTRYVLMCLLIPCLGATVKQGDRKPVRDGLPSAVVCLACLHGRYLGMQAVVWPG